MKITFLKRILIFITGICTLGTTLFFTSCGGQENPYKDTKAWESFQIDTIDNSSFLYDVAIKKIPVYGSKEIPVANVPIITVDQFYWEVNLFCLNKMLVNKISKFAIDANETTKTIKVLIDDNPEVVITDLTLKNDSVLKRVCWNTKILGTNPYSWIYINYKVV